MKLSSDQPDAGTLLPVSRYNVRMDPQVERLALVDFRAEILGISYSPKRGLKGHVFKILFEWLSRNALNEYYIHKSKNSREYDPVIFSSYVVEFLGERALSLGN